MLRRLSFDFWSTDDTESLRRSISALDSSVERFSTAHHSTGTSDSDMAELYLVLSVHTFADICRQIEPSLMVSCRSGIR